MDVAMLPDPIPPGITLWQKYSQYASLNFTKQGITQVMYTDYTSPPVQPNCYNLWLLYLQHLVNKDSIIAPAL